MDNFPDYSDIRCLSRSVKYKVFPVKVEHYEKRLLSRLSVDLVAGTHWKPFTELVLYSF
jgi:hypothetical protein